VGSNPTAAFVFLSLPSRKKPYIIIDISYSKFNNSLMARNALLMGLLLNCVVLAQEPTGFFYKELNLIGGYSDNKGLVGKDRHMLKNSVGFEYFRKFSDQYGDHLTLDLQMRLSYDSLEKRHDAWAVEIHNAWLEYKLGIGKSLQLGLSFADGKYQIVNIKLPLDTTAKQTIITSVILRG
jgi:hypothetical protein